MLTTITELDTFRIEGNLGKKPESKLWEHNDTWWGVFSADDASHVYRLDGTSWTEVLELPTAVPGRTRVDVKAVGDVTHILFEHEEDSKLASIQFVPGSPGTYEMWDARPILAHVELGYRTESATIDLDSTGRMWAAYDTYEREIKVRYSDSPYDDWSAAPIVLASNVKGDDIAVVTALPDNTVGVMWSNQSIDRFGFRVHQDGADPQSWSADEVPASQSAMDIAGGMADDHLNVAVASDGTLYAAVKTGYTGEENPEVALLVRRPNGQWDDMYEINNHGTRPIVQLNESTDQLIYTYDDDGFVFRKCFISTLVCSSPQTLLESGRNASSTKQKVSDDLVIVASGKNSSGNLWGAFLDFSARNNERPALSAGPDLTIYDSQSATLDGTVSDDGLPNPPGVVTTVWSKVSGPGTVAFGNASAVDTSATFSATGTYILRLTADDGELVGTDDTTVTVNPTPINQAPTAEAGPDRTIFLSQAAVLDGTATDDGLPMPPGTLTTEWSLVKGVGTVTFGDANAIDTTATFSTPGVYVLRLTAADNDETTSDDITVTVVEDSLRQTVSFQDGVGGYSGTRDAKIRSDKAETNFGSTSRLELDGNPDFSSLVKWDLTDLPSDAHVVSASITVSVVNDSSAAFQFYELLRPWEEHEATFVQASAGVRWDVSGAQGGGDRSTAVLGELTAAAGGSVTMQLNAAGAAVLQSWIGDPTSNHGFVLQNYLNTATDDLDFKSREASVTTDRPKLSVIYAVPPEISLSVNDLSIDESADAAIFTVSLTTPSNEDVSFDYATSNGTATAGGDYVATSGTKTIPAGATSTSISVNITNDSLDELDETFHVNLSNSSNASISDSIGVGTILDDDVSLSINDVTVDEGAGTATFTVSLSAVVETDVSFLFGTSNGSADASDDYTAATGNRTIMAGSTSTTISIQIIDDLLDEDDETFTVSLSDVTNIAIGDGTAVCLIVNNDAPPGLSIDDIVVDEGTGTATFTVSTSRAIDLDVGFNFITSDVSATSGSDYDATSGSGTIAAGTTSTTVTVNISDDSIEENDEIFEVLLSAPVNATLVDAAGRGTITANDAPTPVAMSFQDEVFPLPNYTGTRDTKIRGDFPDQTFGASAKLEMDGNPDIATLLKWDISTISPQSSVASAAITINVTNSSDDVFNIYQALQPWSESEATFDRYRVGAPWQVAGAQGGNDRGTSILGTATAPAAGSVTIELNSIGIAMVQSWVSDPTTNYGFVLQNYANASTDDLDFSSRDSSEKSLRPKLTVNYFAPTSPLVASYGIEPLLVSGAGLTGQSEALPSPSGADVLPPLMQRATTGLMSTQTDSIVQPAPTSAPSSSGDSRETVLSIPLESSLEAISEDLLNTAQSGHLVSSSPHDRTFESWPY